MPFLKKDKKLYSSPRKIDALKRSPTAMMIFKNFLEGDQAIIFRRGRIEFSSFLLGREKAQKQIQLMLQKIQEILQLGVVAHFYMLHILTLMLMTCLLNMMVFTLIYMLKAAPLASNDIKAPFSKDAAAVPEPATLFLLGTGLVVLAGFGRRKRVFCGSKIVHKADFSQS